MVHRREVGGTEIVFGNQGALWGNAMTWWDTDTGSVWSQPLGEAILGPRTGERLELLTSSLSTWADWKEANPDTLALDVPSGADGFDLETMVIVVELGPESTAFPVPELRQTSVANGIVDDVPVAVVIEPETDRWKVFSRQLDNEVIELIHIDGELAEVGGDRRFDIGRGLPTDGSDQALDQLPGFTSFPGDYITFFPDGSFWTQDGIVEVASVQG
ncbi:MAG: DUF3179 domain-containing protein [Actinomycetia bacterium]|nr:DUF3179 domain-containing protein [Actinomycetes bacterium]